MPAHTLSRRVCSRFLYLSLFMCVVLNSVGIVASEQKAPLRLSPQMQKSPILLKQPRQQTSSENTDQPQGGTGIYVMDGVDFHPIGGGAINGLGWNNQVPLQNYYEFTDNSYLIVTGTVHGEGLISGPGQDDWTFVVKMNMEPVVRQLPTGCRFAKANRPQTDKNATAWKYQIMLVFLDTRTQPECFQYFQSLQNQPFAVELIDIIGPYWTGDKQYQEPKTRLYRTGSMLPLSGNYSSGNAAQPW